MSDLCIVFRASGPAVMIVACCVFATMSFAFEVDTSPQPDTHPPLTPEDGGEVVINPPPMIWRVDENAASYIIELAPTEGFDEGVVRVDGIDMPFYNHSEILAPGQWWWRYFVVDAEGEVSDPSPVKSFMVPGDAVQIPVPPTSEIIAQMPAHPRIFVTPGTLDEYRDRRHGAAQTAWETLKHEADQALETSPPELALEPIPDDPGDDRGRVFVLHDGEGFVPSGYSRGNLNRHARLTAALAHAHLISGEEQYARAAAEWLEFLAPFRIDYHLDHRGSHDTVVFAYEYGLKNVALAYDWVYDNLSDGQRDAIIKHIEYHGENAMGWIRDSVNLHLGFQHSHGQQCMHALLPTILAIADESERAAEWADWMLRQYVNRLPYLARDGGYSEGHYYAYKYMLILDALAAMRTATGIDLFETPQIRGSADFWLYCMCLNYWYQHWGDVYSLHSPIFGNGNDAAISNLLATLTGSPWVKWWSDTVVANPDRLFLWYASESGIEPRPPVDIPQARAFRDVGKLAAYDRFYDHAGNRIFFRSSRYGAHAHAHADQNAFVLHAGGEIMAVDAGHYTYYGDDYWRNFFQASNAHNTLLVNGESQPISITSRGNISAFFNSPRYCTFTGDASEAYDDLLEQFDRTVVFIRPGVFVVYDELAAPEPSEYTWLLNAFEAAQIDEAGQQMTIRQRHMRLGVHHLAPDDMTYAQTDERPHPVLTKAFSRVTEMFPQQFNIRVIPETQRADERILTVMEAYEADEGPAIADLRQIDAENALALAYERDGLSETVLLQSRAQGDRGVTQAGPLASDGVVATLAQAGDGAMVRWMAEGASILSADSRALFSADTVCDVACDYDSPAAAAQIVIAHEEPVQVEASLPEEPSVVLVAPPNEPQSARAVEFAWDDGMLEFALDRGGESVVWIDPVRDLTAPPAPVELEVTDGTGTYTVELESAVADTGEIIAFTTMTPREQGVYEFAAEGAELLVQDRWDPERSTRGHGEITGPVREGAEVFVRFAPDARPRPTLALRESFAGEIVSVLRNGDFEEGNPDYPPRGWNVSHPREMGESWPWWSQEDAVGGESCLKFERPELRMYLNAQPMRLQTGGTYVLRFYARGDATTASVRVYGAMGAGDTVEVEPSETWREYETQIELEPGYTRLVIQFGAGDPPDQVLWVDEMQFGRIEQAE
ncbi:MAG: DUF4962 domain-containing protein [Armatimonadota bacterium]